ncbi:uncharacterized protein ColSpa_07254 [Colletotrichum spaethianum]|uniref:DUF7907 domain-containing protein n=1 Tax=Colletotrichum spaethianum TaxID=700344 RepID=A0AA37LIC1_9PEZI|nr:uncharacterized protein ColSpa_07254 [Colletotrichum spaethianum]GKT47073.1 hypothetical protein ColSpa_07254 [Colletotrichum spaethianum]
MFTQTLLKTALLAAAATAASLPARTTTSSFRIAANVTNFDLPTSLQGQELTYAPNANCKADIIFAPAGKGAVFYAAEDTVNVAHFSVGDETSPLAGLVVTPGGTATVPSLNTVQLQCETGTSGFVSTNEGLRFEDGYWMACPRDGSVVLSFKSAGQRTLAGCADVQLLLV